MSRVTTISPKKGLVWNQEQMYCIVEYIQWYRNQFDVNSLYYNTIDNNFKNVDSVFLDLCKMMKESGRLDGEIHLYAENGIKNPTWKILSKDKNLSIWSNVEVSTGSSEVA